MEIVSEISKNQINKRRHSGMLVLCIFSTQVANAVIIDNLHLISNIDLVLSFFFYILTFFAAIPQAGFSDDSGRKKHLVIANLSVLLSLLLFFAGLELKGKYSESIGIIVSIACCILLGGTGNAIPIARGCISSLKNHDFRSLIGLTTVCIGLGWITVNLLDLIWPPISVVGAACILQFTSYIFIKRFYNYPESKIKLQKPFQTIKRSYRWLFSMLGVTGGASAVCAYLFSEASFYLPYILDELPNAAYSKKAIGLLMGIGYSAGVFTQAIIFPPDKKSIKFGVFFALILMSIVSILNYIQISPTIELGKVYIVEGLSQFLMAVCYGFFVPALFSMMARKVHPDHLGRLFGVIDSTDTAALGISFGILTLKNQLNEIRFAVLACIAVLTIFLFSVIMYANFVKKFKTYED